MKIGYQIKSAINHDLPGIIVFVSSFCSKCHYTRELLLEYIDVSEIIEINIAFSDNLLEELQPKSVPTVMVVDADRRIVSYFENMITEHTAAILGNLLRNL